MKTLTSARSNTGSSTQFTLVGILLSEKKVWVRNWWGWCNRTRSRRRCLRRSRGDIIWVYSQPDSAVLLFRLDNSAPPSRPGYGDSNAQSLRVGRDARVLVLVVLVLALSATKPADDSPQVHVIQKRSTTPVCLVQSANSPQMLKTRHVSTRVIQGTSLT